MIRLLTALLIWASLQACEPVRSDVFVETVNTSLVNQLTKRADTFSILVADSLLRSVNPWLVSGKKLQFQQESKEVILWFDELGNLSGMEERVAGILTDSNAFYPNGQRQFSLIYNKKGIPTGPARYFYSDGRVKKDGPMENGLPAGVWREFAPDGRLISTIDYNKMKFRQKK